MPVDSMSGNLVNISNLNMYETLRIHYVMWKISKSNIGCGVLLFYHVCCYVDRGTLVQAVWSIVKSSTGLRHCVHQQPSPLPISLESAQLYSSSGTSLASPELIMRHVTVMSFRRCRF